MFHRKVRNALLGSILIFSYPGAGLASESTAEEHTYLVGFQDSVDVEVIEDSGGEPGEVWERIDAAAASLTSSEASQLSAQEEIEYVEVNHTVEVTADPPLENWGLEHLDIPEAWDTGVTGEGIDVAVVDTGIDNSHPSLQVTKGFSSVPGVSSFDDDNGHGTHAAGIIAANHPSAGLMGVAPDANLYAVKVLDESGEGPLAQVLTGIDWAIEQDVDIINMSFGTLTDSATMKAMLKEAYENGIIIAAAAGNRGEGTLPEGRVEFPARYDSTIAVGAVDSQNQRASFSANGEAVEIAAPGVNIVSTFKDSTYGALSGTSMATPFVAGAFALMKEAYPSATAAELRSMLHDEALDLGPAGRDPSYGYGLLQLPDLSKAFPSQDGENPLEETADDPAQEPVEEDIEENPIEEDPITTPEEKLHIPVGVEGRVVYDDNGAADVHVYWELPDQESVTAHRIYKNGTLLREVQNTTLFKEENVKPGNHVYRVSAIDADGNESEKSPPVDIVVEEQEEDDAEPEQDGSDTDNGGSTPDEEPTTDDGNGDSETPDSDTEEEPSEEESPDEEPAEEEEPAENEPDPEPETEPDTGFSWPEELADPPSFRDVSSKHWAANSIKELSARGIIKGSDGAFRPNDAVRRGQAMAMIGRFLEWDAEPVATRFPDVDADYFASGFIEHAVDANYINGFPNGTFRPNNDITRGQMAAILGNVFELDVRSVSDADRFTDVQEGTTGYRAIAYLAEEGILSGYDDGTYRPGAPLTRAQFASIFYNLGEHLTEER